MRKGEKPEKPGISGSINYRLSFEEPGCDFLVIEQQIWEASRVLESRLAARDCGFASLRLQIKAGKKRQELEKKLSKLCCQASVLSNMLLDLLRQAEIKDALESCVIKLSSLSPLDWRSPDLFAMGSRREIQQKEKMLGNTLNQLEHKFPDLFSKGTEIKRREQVLALWDPWRQ